MRSSIQNESKVQSLEQNPKDTIIMENFSNQVWELVWDHKNSFLTYTPPLDYEKHLEEVSWIPPFLYHHLRNHF